MSNQPEPLDPESRAAARLAHRGDPGLDVYRWLHGTHHAVLGTLSTEHTVTGYPTASIVPFALDEIGRPIIFIAGIALHTRNLRADSRASLFVHDPSASGDPQASWRASVNGHFVRLSLEGDSAGVGEHISDHAYDRLMARYSERVPNARGYAKTHDFHFWRMERIESIRYIAGFGRICSFGGSGYLAHAEEEWSKDARAGALKHMNDDHAENMREICDAFHGTGAEEVSMVALERCGCLLETDQSKRSFFFSFSKLIEEPKEFRTQIIDLLMRARERARVTAGS